MPERLNRALIEVSNEDTVELPWPVRDELLVRAKQVRSMGGIANKIEGVGATRPAVLEDAAELLAVEELVKLWERDVAVETPPAIRELGAAVARELDRKRATAGEVGIGEFEAGGRDTR